jgi:DNA-binding winged helix-turn-helix (wHTH) protein/Tfp pilus assembly protein PilF
LNAAAHVYAFGDFRFDPARRILSRESDVVKLPERIAQLLWLLVQAEGTIVTMQTIEESIWPNVSVSRSNLNQHVYLLRQLLGEYAADREYVMTVRGKGYRLAAPVRILTPKSGASHDVLFESGLEAFHQFGVGSHLVDQQTAASLAEAISHFEAALRAAPDYVPALVGLARVYVSLAENGYVSGSSAFPRAGQVLSRAIELDRYYAPAYAARATFYLFSERRLDLAKEDVDRALDLEHHCVPAHVSAALLHVCRGSNDRALAEMQQALAIDPASSTTQVLLGRVLLLTGTYQQAIRSLSALIDAGTASSAARRYRAQARILCGQPGDALSDLLVLARDRAEDLAFRLPLLARAHADCGDLPRAAAIYDSLCAAVGTEFVSHVSLAIVAYGLNRVDAALVHLETAAERGEPGLLFLRSAAWFEGLRGNPRYQSIADGTTEKSFRRRRASRNGELDPVDRAAVGT